ncbi:MAG: hypothetical protein Q4F33_04515 [Mycoplasmatota bacterium]|nr:hypothetical protein [Mycoplasmatota bacterium]
MIGSFTYDQILQISKELSDNADIIDNLAKSKGADMLQTFISNVTWYATFLKSTVELYKDADEVLANLKK